MQPIGLWQQVNFASFKAEKGPWDERPNKHLIHEYRTRGIWGRGFNFFRVFIRERLVIKSGLYDRANLAVWKWYKKSQKSIIITKNNSKIDENKQNNWLNNQNQLKADE